MKRTIIAVTLLFVAGAAGVTWNEFRRGQKAADALAVFAIESARTKTAIRAMEQRVAVAERDRAEQSAAFAGASQAEPVTKASASSARAVDVAAIYKKYREREKDPKVQAIRLASWRAQLIASHGVLFRKLGLTTSQIERFQDIAARKDEQNVDLDGIARKRGREEWKSFSRDQGGGG